jgi:hypothetical protein
MREGQPGFDLDLVEANGALLLWPSGLAYVEQPCLVPVPVPVDRPAEAGFDRKLTDALSNGN